VRPARWRRQPQYLRANRNRAYDTLHGQLKTLLAKTGAHHQTERVVLPDAFRTTPNFPQLGDAA
jgi:hypothetical protein